MMEPTPGQTVFGITELLDKVFSFVDTKNLCTARQVCHRWREVSKMSLKRRLQLTSVDRYSFSRRTASFSEHEKERSYVLTDEILDKACLTVQDVANPIGEYYDSKITKCTTLLVTVLEQDWLPYVRMLTLDRCLTVDEWNFVGCRILKKFPVIEHLDVRMTPSNTTAVLPLSYNEMKEDSTFEEFDFPLLRRVYLTLQVTDQGDEDEPSRACIDVLDQCPYLMNVSVTWKLEKALGSMEILAYEIEDVDSENFGDFKCKIYDRMSRKIANTCAQAIMQDLSKVLSVTKPKELTLSVPCHPDLISIIPLSVSEELHTVTLDIGTLEERKQQQAEDDDDFWFEPEPRRRVQQREPAEDLLLPFFSTTAFTNVQKLVVKGIREFRRLLPQHSRIMTLPFPKVAVVEFSRIWERFYDGDAGIFPDAVLDSWMNKQLWSLAPSTKLLVVSFGVIRSRLTALKMAKNFPSLKHLVLINVRPYEEILEIDAADLDVTETQCLQGLQGVTIVTQRPAGLEDYIRAFVKACDSVSTIRKLSVHCCRELDREINLTSLGIAIPENLTVETRSIDGDRNKMVLDGVEDSMMTWEHLDGFV